MDLLSLKSMVEGVKKEVIDWRRHLHRYPEIAYREEKTAQFVCDTLESFGSLELSRPTTTSVMARLRGRSAGKVLAMRADMDALPIQEENDFDFVSKHPGVMHACGHDGHTAMLLGAAKLLVGLRDHLCGEVRFLFQHAEELFPGGAIEMVKAGVMDGVNAVIGGHLWSPMETGEIGVICGTMTAAPDTFRISIIGKGGHAALPHQATDTIAIAAQVVTNLQHIVSRQVDPLANAVISVCTFHGGTAHNILPEIAKLSGTVRSFDPELRQNIQMFMQRLINGITEAHAATYTFEYENGYDPVINHVAITNLLSEIVRETLGQNALKQIQPLMIGEDFSAFQKLAPGSFFLIGAGNTKRGIIYPHHHPRFTIDEEALTNGVLVFIGTALKFLV